MQTSYHFGDIIVSFMCSYIFEEQLLRCYVCFVTKFYMKTKHKILKLTSECMFSRIRLYQAVVGYVLKNIYFLPFFDLRLKWPCLDAESVLVYEKQPWISMT